MAPVLPLQFHTRLGKILQTARQIEGFLTDREMRFLALLAACPTTQGDVLELGAYHGKSTVILAQAAALCDQKSVVTVDCGPMDSLNGHLRRLDLDRQVEVYHQRSEEFVSCWRRPLRLLWHDGANEYATVKHDVQMLLPHVCERGIVAFHDVLNPTGDRVLVFIEQILADDQFGPVGLCGSIGWAQVNRRLGATKPFEKQKLRLARKLQAVAPYQGVGRRPPQGMAKLHYKLLRTLTPHGAVKPQSWLKKVA